MEPSSFDCGDVGENTVVLTATDAAGNISLPTQREILVATDRPTLTITDDEPGVANIAGGDVVFTFTFSHDVSGFTTDDVTVSNGTKGAFSSLSASVYTLIVSPDQAFQGSRPGTSRPPTSLGRSK